MTAMSTPESPSQPAGDRTESHRDAATEPEAETVGADQSTTSSAEPEVIDLEVRETRSGITASKSRPFPDSFAHTVGEVAMSLTLRSWRAGFTAAGLVARGVAGTAAGRMVGDAVRGALDSVATNDVIDWDLAERRAEEQVGRVIAVVAPVIVQAIDAE